MAVAIMPGLFMTVIATRGKELIEHRRQVLLEAGFEFNGADGGSAADVEDVYCAGAHMRFAHHARDFARQILHLAVAGSLELHLSLINHALLLPGNPPSGQTFSGFTPPVRQSRGSSVLPPSELVAPVPRPARHLPILLAGPFWLPVKRFQILSRARPHDTGYRNDYWQVQRSWRRLGLPRHRRHPCWADRKFMIWMTRSERDTATDALEKRLWNDWQAVSALETTFEITV